VKTSPKLLPALPGETVLTRLSREGSVVPTAKPTTVRRPTTATPPTRTLIASTASPATATVSAPTMIRASAWASARWPPARMPTAVPMKNSVSARLLSDVGSPYNVERKRGPNVWIPLTPTVVSR
jgi:hypothetical protein